MNHRFFQMHRFVMLLAAITFIAFALRIQCCFWGNPLELHPDEGATVHYAIDMLSRHSWEAHTYDRPDHFEIKCDAVLFTIVSWLIYHKPAYEAFPEHRMVFFILARCYTALFGAALVPLAAIFTGALTEGLGSRYQRMAQMCAAILIAFSAIFVQHSAYATPDIVLTFFVLLFAYGMMRYLENGNKKYRYLCMVTIGIGITIKYPSAILCIPLAGMVIYRACFIDKKWGDVIRYGILSIGVILLTIFMLAPNLITDIHTVYVNFIEEARPYHLGADGLGFYGNLMFYLKTILCDLGSITIVPFMAGLAYVAAHRSPKWLCMLVGLIFWLCMSVLSLHWLRWGIPMYPFYIIMVAIGIGAIAQASDQFFVSKRTLAYTSKGVAALFSILILLNAILSGLSITKYSTLPDMRMAARDFLEQNGITAQNSLYEGYTPFAPSSAFSHITSFTETEHGVKVKIKYASKKYFVMSNSFKKRYQAEADRYVGPCAIYNGLDTSYEIIYRGDSDGNYETNQSILKNIIHSWDYLTGIQRTTGDTITVYDMNPEYITLQTASGQYLSAATEENGAGLQLSGNIYQWIKYDCGNDTYAFLSSQSGLALDITGGVFSPNTRLELWEAHGGTAQQWQMMPEEDFYYVICGDNLALTCDEHGVYLSKYEQREDQRWFVTGKGDTH